MTGDAEAGEATSPARRPARTLLLVLAVLLLLGGGTAVAVGALGQVADPPQPSAAAERPTPSSTSAPSATSTCTSCMA